MSRFERWQTTPSTKCPAGFYLVGHFCTLLARLPVWDDLQYIMTTTALPYIEKVMPLAEAARRFGVSQTALRYLIESGRIKAVALPNGEVGVSENGIRAMQIEHFIPLPEAAQRLNVSEDQLRLLIRQSVVKAAELPNGDIGVSESSMLSAVNDRLRLIRRDSFKKMQGRPITISQAEQQYEIPGTTLRGWIKRGYIRILDEKHYPVELDLADVAFCAAVYRIRKAFDIRAPLLDEDGRPYLLKHPALSQYRRRRKGIR